MAWRVFILELTYEKHKKLYSASFYQEYNYPMLRVDSQSCVIGPLLSMQIFSLLLNWS